MAFSILLIHVSSCVLGEGSVSIMLMSRYMLLLYQAQSQAWIQNCNEIPENDQFYYESPPHWIFQELVIWLLKIWIWWCLALKVMWFLCLQRGREEIIQRENPNLCKCSFCVYVVYNIKVSLSFILFYFKLTKDIKYNFLKHRKKQSNYCRLNIIFPVIFFVLMSFSNS